MGIFALDFWYYSDLPWILSKKFASILLLFAFQGLFLLAQTEPMPLKSCTGCRDVASSGIE